MPEYADPRTEVLDAELVAVDGVPVEQLMPQPLQNPPAVRTTCVCGKDGTPESHGLNPATGHRALTCDEVLGIRRRVEGRR